VNLICLCNFGANNHPVSRIICFGETIVWQECWYTDAAGAFRGNGGKELLLMLLNSFPFLAPDIKERKYIVRRNLIKRICIQREWGCQLCLLSSNEMSLDLMNEQSFESPFATDLLIDMFCLVAITFELSPHSGHDQSLSSVFR
jgi:hypothetical protein